MKLMIASPVSGHPDSAFVSLKYHREVMRVARDSAVVVCDPFVFMPIDIVRARSRAMQMFRDSDCDFLLYWDCDNAPDNSAVQLRLMLQAITQEGRHVVGCTYPKKNSDWDKCADYAASHPGATGPELEAASQTWVVTPGQTVATDGVAEVDGLGFGFILLDRECAAMMSHGYARDLTFVDKGVPTVAVFMPLILPDGRLLSEDLAFCHRWRALGGKVHMLCLPIHHVGGHLYRGHAQGLIGEAR